jgi:N-carbamoylputrescine amidase
MTEEMASTVAVGLVQVLGGEPFEAAQDRAEKAVVKAAAAGAAIVVLPEFTPRRRFPAERGAPKRLSPPPGAVSAWAAALSRRYGCYLHCVDVERATADRWYNTARLYGPGGEALVHRKRHLPDEPGFRETAWYAPGTDGPRVAFAAGAKVGALTCSDAMFPDEARALGRQGADLLLVPRATPAEPRSMQRWSVMLRADAIVSGAYVVSVNRVGTEGEIGFAGHSVVIAPDGEVLVELGADPEVRVVELDLTATRAAKHSYPVLIDRDDWA